MKSVALGALTEVGRPITYGVVQPGDDPGDGVPLVRAGDVTDGRVVTDSLRTVTPEVSRQFARTVLKGGELLVSLVGNPGEVAIAPTGLCGANLSRQVAMVALDASVDAKYVKYYLSSGIGRAEMFTRTGGAVQQVINLSDLKTIPIALPGLDRQRRVSDCLSDFDDLIDNNRRRIKLLEDSVRLLFDEWFVRLRFPGHELAAVVDGVPVGWTREPLGAGVVLRYGKALKAEARSADGDVPVYGSSGVVGTHEKAMVPGPAIIVGRKGNVGSVFWCARDFWPIDTVYFVDAPTSDLYLYYALRNMHFISTDVAVPGLNRDFAYSRPMLSPPAELRARFLDVAGPIHQQIDTLAAMNEKLRTARDLLLPRLMSGELAV